MIKKSDSSSSQLTFQNRRINNTSATVPMSLKSDFLLMKVIYYQLVAMTGLLFCGRLKALKRFNNQQLTKTKKWKNNKSKLRILKVKSKAKSRLRKSECQGPDRKKRLLQSKRKRWMISRRKRMREISLWLLSRGKGRLNSQIILFTKVKVKLLQWNFNSSSLMGTEPKIAAII